jgi:hypothetical protein
MIPRICPHKGRAVAGNCPLVFGARAADGSFCRYLRRLPDGLGRVVGVWVGLTVSAGLLPGLRRLGLGLNLVCLVFLAGIRQVVFWSER